MGLGAHAKACHQSQRSATDKTMTATELLMKTSRVNVSEQNHDPAALMKASATAASNAVTTDNGVHAKVPLKPHRQRPATPLTMIATDSPMKASKMSSKASIQALVCPTSVPASAA